MFVLTLTLSCIHVNNVPAVLYGIVDSLIDNNHVEGTGFMYDNVWEKFMYSSQFSADVLPSTCVCEVVVCSRA